MVDRDDMQGLIATIACLLVDDPTAVRVDVAKREEDIVLRLTVAPGDVGKVIGKQGMTVRSMRTILAGASKRMHCRFSLEVMGPEKPLPSDFHIPGPSDGLTVGRIMPTLTKKPPRMINTSCLETLPQTRCASQDGLLK